MSLRDKYTDEEWWELVEKSKKPSNKIINNSLESNLKRSESLKGKTTKPKKIIKEFDSNMEFIKEWESVSLLIKFYRDNNLGFDYTTFLKKQQNKQLYKNKYWL